MTDRQPPAHNKQSAPLPKNPWRWLSAEVVFEGDEGKTRRGQFLLRVLRFLLAGLAATVVLGLLGPGNEVSSVLLADAPALLWIVGCAYMVRRGWVSAAGWVVSVMFWGLISVVVWFFGGLMANNAVAYGIAVMIAGATVGGRGLWTLMGMSVGACTAAMWAAETGQLPNPLGPLTHFNAWIAITVTLVIVSLLHQMTVKNLDQALVLAHQSAQDHQRSAAALRQSQAENEARALAAIALSRLGERALSSPQLQDFYVAALESAQELVDARSMLLFEHTPGGENLRLACTLSAPHLTIGAEFPLESAPFSTLREPGQGRHVGLSTFCKWLGWSPSDSPKHVAVVAIPGRSSMRGYLCMTCNHVPDAPFNQTSETFAVALCALIGSAMERAHTEEQLRQAHKMELVGRLAGGIAHDFNNILMAIMGATDTMRAIISPLPSSQPASSPPATQPALPNPPADPAALFHEILDELDAASERARLLTSQLLTFSRRQAITSRAQNLNAIICDLLPVLRRLIGPAIHIEPHLCDATPTVMADRSHIEQILLNLAVNARDAMPIGGTLRIETDVQQDGKVLLRVADSGVGMDAQTQRQIFEPFFTTKPTGTGLGLSTVSDIAKHLQGQIAVQSAPEHGTTFTLSLPAPLAFSSPTA